MHAKKEIVLIQQDAKNNTSDKYEYKVKSLKNTQTPPIGNIIDSITVSRLMRERDMTVKIVDK